MYFQPQYAQQTLLAFGVFADTQWVWEQDKCLHCGCARVKLAGWFVFMEGWGGA